MHGWGRGWDDRQRPLHNINIRKKDLRSEEEEGSFFCFRSDGIAEALAILFCFSFFLFFFFNYYTMCIFLLKVQFLMCHILIFFFLFIQICVMLLQSSDCQVVNSVHYQSFLNFNACFCFPPFILLPFTS